MKELFRTENLVFQEKIAYPDLRLKKGGAIFISGPSGSGKSSLLRLLNGTMSPSGGKIYFNGEDIESIDTIALRRKVILGGQAVFLFRGSILENFEAYHKYHESNSPIEIEIEEFLRLCGAPFGVSDLCDTMSGGERQRVFLAILLSLLPEVILLDEPTSALDGALSIEVIDNILGFCEEKEITPMIVSHDMGLRDRFAKVIVEIGGETK